MHFALLFYLPLLKVIKMSINKLKYQNNQELKNIIFKSFNAKKELKDAIFTILCTIQERYPKLRLKDIKFISDNDAQSKFFYIEFFYKSILIKKTIPKAEIKNLETIFIDLLK